MLVESSTCGQIIIKKYNRLNGLDIGASCGQFLFDYYDKFN